MRDSGWTLTELVVAVAVGALLAAMTVPNLGEARRAAALRATAFRIQGLMFRCRSRAIVSQHATALVFERDANGGWRCFAAEDGDGDGVLRRDLERGDDRVLGKVVIVDPGGAGPGILRQVPVPDPLGHGWLGGDLDDPVRAGRGDIITFTPAGRATPSSIYLSDHSARMRVLRVYGGTARVRTLVWRVGWDAWRRTGL